MDMALLSYSTELRWVGKSQSSGDTVWCTGVVRFWMAAGRMRPADSGLGFDHPGECQNAGLLIAVVLLVSIAGQECGTVFTLGQFIERGERFISAMTEEFEVDCCT
jgi:hypothetical protein